MGKASSNLIIFGKRKQRIFKTILLKYIHWMLGRVGTAWFE
jgi:hypothetical protein